MASLSSLPAKALEAVFLYLDPKTAFTAFIYVSKRCFGLLLSSDLRSQYMNLQFGLTQDYQPSFAAFKRLFRRETCPRWIPLIALLTTGGVDKNTHYWAQNMFSPGHHCAYCSNEHKNNIVVAAVLSELVHGPPTPDLIQAQLLVSGLIRGSWRLRGVSAILPKDSAEDLTEEELVLTKELIRLDPTALVPWKPDENAAGLNMWLTAQLPAVESAVSLLYEALANRETGMSYRDSDYMHLEWDVQAVSMAKVLFFTRTVLVSRFGKWSCPVETFLICISEDFLEAESPELVKFNDILQVTDLKSPNFPEIIHYSETNFHIYCEFQRSSAQFHPVIWGKFKSKQDVELQVELKQGFAGKYVYVKLINPENRMREMGDRSEFTNIDCRFVGVRGSVERFGPE